MAKAKRKRTPVESFILDCSVVLAWFFSDESSEYADAVAAGIVHASAVAPALWALEVANTLIVGERRGRCTADQSAAFLARLARLPITLEAETFASAWSGSISIARGHRISAYDATYLELALRRGLPLATLDDRLNAVAGALGIERYEP